MLPKPQRLEFLSSLDADQLAFIEHDWEGFWARDDQLPPLGDWRVWLAICGRGWGKTRVGAEWCHQRAAISKRRIAIIAANKDDARKVCVEGDSGILATAKPWFRPVFEPSKNGGTVTWPNGTIAELYSGEKPSGLRGPQFHDAWCDETAKWARMQDAWDMLEFALRLGNDPRKLVTTTPTPAKLIKDLVKEASPSGDTRITRGSTYANAANLAQQFLDRLRAKYEGTRLGRQELHGEILEDKPGALWTLRRIEEGRRAADKLPEFTRVVVAIDPPTTSGEDADECGIVVAALGRDRHAYVLADASEQGLTPKQWAEKAVAQYVAFGADRIVAEINQGGEMVENTIRQIDANIAYRGVHAKHGKVTRAEPVSALYEQQRVHHVGVHKELETQMTDFTADFSRDEAGYSPDRVDALVYAITELMLGTPQAKPSIRSL